MQQNCIKSLHTWVLNKYIPKSIQQCDITTTRRGKLWELHPEYQLSSRVATSQLKEPRVMKVDTRGVILKDSRVKGGSNTITTVANPNLQKQKTITTLPG